MKPTLRHTRWSVLAVAAVLAAAGCGGNSRQPERPTTAPLTVNTSSGRLHGLATPTAHQFLGIRFAQPPTGARRWKAPQPVSAATGTTQATKPGPRCAQAAATPGAKAATTEDCLFLNVTTPRDRRPGEKLPVMVWWHGGGYTTGAGSDYDAQRLASQGRVIVVTANYRLGAFGYFGLKGLPGSGTFGLADQLASLRWADSNARAFGGDPGNVTVFGESAGAMSTCAVLSSPKARGLVDKAAVMSGSCLLDWFPGALYPGAPNETPYKPLATDEADGARVAASVGCGHGNAAAKLACLRSLPASDVVKLNNDFADHLSYGTDLLPGNPATALRRGDFAHVPVLSGGNKDEARSFVGGALLADPAAVTTATYPKLLAAAFGDRAADVAAAYPVKKYGSAALAWSTVITDGAWTCPTLAGDRALAARTTVYAYEFADPQAPNVNGLKVPGLPLGASHATDLPSLFDLGGKSLLRTSGQQALSSRMIDYWSSFAHDGRPVAPKAPSWSRATAGPAPSKDVLRLTPSGDRMVDAAAAHHCAFWQDIR